MCVRACACTKMNTWHTPHTYTVYACTYMQLIRNALQDMSRTQCENIFSLGERLKSNRAISRWQIEESKPEVKQQ